MSKELIPFTEVQSWGKIFYEARLFPDTASAAQAAIKVQAGQEVGVAPFAAMSGIYIIQGRLTFSASLLARMVKKSTKYNYKVIEINSDACEIEFFEEGESAGKSKFTKEMAKRAGTKNTDKFPENMLFARALSNGVKWFCPDVVDTTVYVTEEFEAPETTQDAPSVDVTPEPKPELNPLHPKWNGAVKAIEEKKCTVQQIEDAYILTEEDKVFLEHLYNGAPRTAAAIAAVKAIPETEPISSYIEPISAQEEPKTAPIMSQTEAPVIKPKPKTPF